MMKRLVRSAWFRNLVGSFFAWWFRFVHRSCRIVFEPADFYENWDRDGTVIVTTWHGEHFMLPFMKPFPEWQAKAMISRSQDGDMNVIVCEKLGIGAIRASGGRTGSEVSRRGGVAGAVMALRELAAGMNVMLTADIPKGPARIAGEGIVQIARHSGRPIVPVAYATTHCLRMTRSWDRAALALPFGRFAFVIGAPISVDRHADAEALEAARLRVEAALNELTARAYELAGGTP